MWEKDPRTGWKTVEVRRNDVPAQNASMAEPPSALAIIFVTLGNFQGAGVKHAYW